LSAILKYLSCFVFLILLNQDVLGQNTDSLKVLLKNARHDSVKLRLRFEIGEADMLFRVGYWDSLISDSKKAQDKKIEAAALNNLGFIYDSEGDITKALECFELSLGVSRKNNDKKNIANVLNNIGFIYKGQGDATKALEYYQKSLVISKEINEKLSIANTLSNIGLIYHHRGDVLKALDYYQQSLSIQEEINDKDGIASTLNNIGSIYDSQKNYDKALENFNKCLKIHEETKNKGGIAGNLINIGYIYRVQGNYPKALECYEASLKLYEELGSLNGISVALNNIGSIYDAKGDAKKALECYNKALKNNEQIGNKKEIASSVINIARSLIMDGKYEDAKAYALRGMQLSKELAYPREIVYAANILKSIYTKQNNYKSAFEMYELEIKMRDSLNNIEIQSSTIKKEMQYDFEKRELKNKAEQDKKDLIASEEQQKQKIIIYAVSIGFFIVLVLGLLILRGYRQKQKANTIITLQKAEVTNQKHLVEEKHKEIMDSINYAERIQRSFLATKDLLDDNLKEYFVFFKPKDIVSGDFYWASKIIDSNGSESFGLVTADSTGHGVPGAIMSLLNITSLESALKDGHSQPADILNATRQTIIERLKKDGSEQGGKDGMDASIIILNKEKTLLKYAAANNPIWVVRQNELIELKPDKMPLGKHDKDTIPFAQYEFALQKQDVIFALTDGMPDQFGGQKGKKFMYKQLKELLVSNAQESMEKQKQILNDSLIKWQGDLEQVDDITIIGVRV
jgi:tetratricopeptide (TPR) repeat protein/serine phosphatase RsbU (regulator of sigma subunit)